MLPVFNELTINLHDLNIYSIVLRCVLAVLFGAIFGIERTLKNRPAGVRTYILVCLASAAVMMTNIHMSQVHDNVDPTRIAAQVISGIGFLGAGTILTTRNNEVKGLTTAALLWTSAVVGLVIGAGFYTAAIVMAVLVLLIMTQFKKVKQQIKKKTRFMQHFYIFETADDLEKFLVHAAKKHWTINSLQRFDEKSFDDKHAYNITIKLPEAYSAQTFEEELRLFDGLMSFEEIDEE